MIAQIIHARIAVDDRDCALLTVENALTGTEECPSYRVSLDVFAERRTLVAEIKLYDRTGKTRLDLLAEAFTVIAAQERVL